MDALEYQKTNNVEASNRDELCTYFLQIRYTSHTKLYIDTKLGTTKIPKQKLYTN